MPTSAAKPKAHSNLRAATVTDMNQAVNHRGRPLAKDSPLDHGIIKATGRDSNWRYEVIVQSGRVSARRYAGHCRARDFFGTTNRR
jgi:hypothetical protein